MGKWDKWEYWPAYMFYIPILPYYIYLAIKSWHPVFFAAANPNMEAGGSGFESKYQTMMLIPEKWRPETILIPKTQDVSKVVHLLKQTSISYPFIIKPDVGFRGLLVNKIRNEAELKKYLSRNQLDLIIQSFVSGNVEYGIFYHKVPGNQSGIISSLTQKVYLQVRGDGTSTVLELMNDAMMEERFIDMVIENRGNDYVNKKPRENELVVLSYIGNHSKGATFVNKNAEINKQLTQVIDELHDEINGWHYGRLDIKVDSMEALLKGDSIQIIEINGVMGEPAHIYDSTKMNYTKAIKEILKHWDFIYDVSKASRKQGAKCYNTFEMLAQIVKLIKHKLKLEKWSKMQLESHPI